MGGRLGEDWVMRAIHMIIPGRVQGVGYRAFVERVARARGLEGWVRNCSDGSVETVIAGPDDTIEATMKVLRRGPAGAKVINVEVHDSSPNAAKARLTGEEFSVLPTL
jgi:acylphosphatase